MLTALFDLNWLAVIAATIVFAVLGGAYFTAVVGKPYKIALGNEDRELPKPGAIFIIGPLIASLLVVVTTATLLRALEVTAIGEGIVFGLVVSIGYLVAQTLNIAINPNFPRPLLYTHSLGTRMFGPAGAPDPEDGENILHRAVVEQLSTVARDAGISMTHLASGFVMAHPSVTSAMIGPRTLAQLDDLLAGAAVTLDDDVLDRIDEIAPPGTDVGVSEVAYVPQSPSRTELRRRPAKDRATA